MPSPDFDKDVLGWICSSRRTQQTMILYAACGDTNIPEKKRLADWLTQIPSSSRSLTLDTSATNKVRY